MTSYGLLIVWLVLGVPLVAGLYWWRRQAVRRAARRDQVPVEVLSRDEELARALRREDRE